MKLYKCTTEEEKIIVRSSSSLSLRSSLCGGRAGAGVGRCSGDQSCVKCCGEGCGKGEICWKLPGLCLLEIKSRLYGRTIDADVVFFLKFTL